MAIQHIPFNNTTGRTSMYNDLYSFLTTYAADYFDEITKDDETSFIYCKINDVNVITFKCGGGPDTLSTTAGKTTSVPEIANFMSYFTGAYITSKGFALTPANYAYNSMLFVYKNTDGNTAVKAAFDSRKSASATTTGATTVIGTFRSSNFFKKTVINASTSFQASYTLPVFSTSATSLAPVCTSDTADTIADGFYYVPFSQYVGQVGIIEINGKRYVYDGVFALEE